jgi:hypothetical protein
MPSSLKANAPPWSAKLTGGTPDSDAPEPFPPAKQLASIQTALGSTSGSSSGGNRPQSPFRSLSSSGMLKQRSTDAQPHQADDPLASGSSSRPSSSTLPPQSPIDGPGMPGGGRRGTLSKGSKAARGSSWLANGSAFPAEGEEDDDDVEDAHERDGLLNGQPGRGRDGVVAAKGLRVHVLDEDGEVLRAGEAVGDEEGGFGITIERPYVLRACSTRSRDPPAMD